MIDDDRHAPWYPEVGKLIVAFGNVEYLVTLLARVSDVPENKQPAKSKYMGLGERLRLIERYVVPQPFLSHAAQGSLCELIRETRAFANDRRNHVAHNPICSIFFTNEDQSEHRIELGICGPAGKVEPLPLEQLIASRDTARDLAHRWMTFHAYRSDARTQYLLGRKDGEQVRH